MAEQNYDAWWEKEKPLAPLPEHLQHLLRKNDPLFIDELKKYAFSFVNPYRRENKRGGSYYRGLNQSKDYSWIWTLYLDERRLAKQGILELLDEYSSNEMLAIFSKAQSAIDGLYAYNNPYLIRSYNQYTFVNQASPYYPYLKAIYKLAEKKQDALVWSRLAYRFDAEDRYHIWLYKHSNSTRLYLRRRAWRFLRQLGQGNSSEYVNCATEVLLHYEPINKRSGELSTAYLHLWLLNHILHHNSMRFSYKGSSNNWKFHPQLDDGDKRVEAFPRLWDQNPQALWRLLCEAKINPVVEFAGRALIQGNPDFVRNITDYQLQELSNSSVPSRRAFACRISLERMLDNEFHVNKWLDYLCSKHLEECQEAEKFVYRHLAKLADVQQNQMVELLIDRFTNAKFHVSSEVAIRLLRNDLFFVVKRVLTPSLIVTLSQSVILEMQQFAVELLTEMGASRFLFTGDVLLPLLISENATLRDAARNLLIKRFTELQLDASFLLELISLPSEEHQVFATQFLADRLLWIVPHLPVFIQLCELKVMDSSVEESVREYILNDILGSLFFAELQNMPLRKILLYLGSDNSKFQEFGARLLDLTQPNAYELSFSQLLELAHSKVARVRVEARLMIEKRAENISPDWICNLIETDWDDTREWMSTYVRQLKAQEVTAELVYGLLDTARTDVQQLAMELVQQYESQLDLRELLLRAGESPYLTVQEYALILTNGVEWDKELFDQLELFLRTVLFHVAKGSKAKKLAYDLLFRLGEQDEEMASRVLPLLADMARSAGKKEFEQIMLTMTRIQTCYPQMQTPVTLI